MRNRAHCFLWVACYRFSRRRRLASANGRPYSIAPVRQNRIPIRARAHRLAVQDVALSRRKHGFDSRWARQLDQCLVGRNSLSGRFAPNLCPISVAGLRVDRNSAVRCSTHKGRTLDPSSKRNEVRSTPNRSGETRPSNAARGPGSFIVGRLLIEWSQVRVLLGEPTISGSAGFSRLYFLAELASLYVQCMCTLAASSRRRSPSAYWGSALALCRARLEPVPEAHSLASVFCQHLAGGRIRQGLAAPCQSLFFLSQFQWLSHKQ